MAGDRTETADPGVAPTEVGTEPDLSGEPDGALAEGALAVGERLGRYQLRRWLGAGGMGQVFAAYDPELDREVAVKVLRSDGMSAAQLRDNQQRLRREGRTMAQVAHPNVIRVYDVGVDRGHVFVAMELVEGETLAAWLAAAPRPREEILPRFVAVGRGLAAAHEVGLVHRDVKPSNVLVGRDGRVLVTDFGLARPVRADGDLSGMADGGAAAHPSGGAGAGPPRTITRADGLIGTPAYMAPEQHRGLPADARADQFGFCVALYRGLCGQAPFAGEGWAELAASTTAGALRPPVGLPAWLKGLLERGLAAEPALRFPSMAALVTALEAEPARRRRRWRVAIAAAVLALGAGLGAVGLFLGGAAPPPCVGGPDRFAGIWDDDARRGLAMAFTATGAPYAAEALRAIETRLDRFRSDWEAMRRDSCEATHVRHEQSAALLDARAACLQRRLVGATALLEALRRSDATAVQHAAEAADALPGLEGCADAEALARRTPLPADAAQRREIAALEADLARLSAQKATAGRDRTPLAPLERVRDRARTLGYPPLLAEAQLQIADIQQFVNRWDAAAASLEESLLAAESAGDDRLRFQALTMLIMVNAHGLERDAEAQAFGRRAEALLARIGPDPALASLLACTRAYDDVLYGRYQRARQQAERCATLSEQANGADSQELLRALHTLGVVLQDAGDSAASLPPLERALAIAERRLGRDHPTVGHIAESLGNSLRHLRRLDEAEALFRRNLAIVEAAPAPVAADRGNGLINLANVLADRDRLPDAVATARQAVALLEGALGPDHRLVADAAGSLADILSRLGADDEALRIAQRSLAIYRQHLGDASPVTAAAHALIGQIHGRAGRNAEALEANRAELAAIEASPERDRGSLAQALWNVGDDHMYLDQPAAARPIYERALDVIGDDRSLSEKRAGIQVSLAQALWSSPSEQARALALVRDSRSRYLAVGFDTRSADTLIARFEKALGK